MMSDEIVILLKSFLIWQTKSISANEFLRKFACHPNVGGVALNVLIGHDTIVLRIIFGR